MPRILLVDDYYEDFEAGLKSRFGDENVFIQKTPNVREILRKIAGPPQVDLVLLDVRFEYDEQGNPCSPRDLGSTLLEKVKQAHPAIPVLMLTTTAKETNPAYPLSNGVISKPDNFSNSKFYETLFNEASYWVEVSNANWDEKFGIIIGNNPQMIDVAKSIVRFAKYRSARIILVTGETGTGKEEICKAIHRESGLRDDDDSYQVVHCGIKEPRDLRIELGGYPRQAQAERPVGVLEKLEGVNWQGTLVLDEVDDLNLESQNILNRLLEGQPFPQENNPGRSFRPGPKLRFIFTAQRDLRQMVTAKQFRQDLWGRMNSCRIYLPPLRERKEIIRPLYEFYVKKLTKDRFFDDFLKPDVEDKLKKHDYPENIRGFRNILEKALARTSNSPLRAEDIILEDESPEANNLFNAEPIVDLILRKELTWETINKKGINRKSDPMKAILERLMEEVVTSRQDLTEGALADYLGTTRAIVAKMIEENGLREFKKLLKNRKTELT